MLVTSAGEGEDYDHGGELPQWLCIFALSSDIWRTGAVWVAECPGASRTIPEPSQDLVRKIGITHAWKPMGMGQRDAEAACR